MIEPASSLKSCCADVYASDWAKLLLGDSLHPGGLALTARLASLLDIDGRSRVLDVAAGRGASAAFLSGRYGCSVVGLDYSQANAAEVVKSGQEPGGNTVRAVAGDGERLPFRAASFDAAICECAYCTFPDGPAAAAELARVVGPGGRLGLSDVMRSGSLPAELSGLLGTVACVGAARSVDEYAAELTRVGFEIEVAEPRPRELLQLVDEIRDKLKGAELLARLTQITLPGVDFGQASRVAALAAEAIQDGALGYVLIAARNVGRA